MEIDTIIFSLSVPLVFLIIYFYITDFLRLKKIKNSIEPIDFLKRLKLALIKYISDQRLFTFLLIIISLILLSTSILIKIPAHNYYMDKEISYNEEVKNAYLLESFLKELYEKQAKSTVRIITIFECFFFIVIIISSIHYLYTKANKGAIIEEAINEKNLKDMLSKLKVNKLNIEFYQSIVKKFGKSSDKEVHKVLSEFIYDTMEIHI